MSSLFESFDPLMSSFNWNISISFFTLTLPLWVLFFSKFMRQNQTFLSLKAYMFSELSASLSNPNFYIQISYMSIIFFLILSLNLMGLIPYVYTLTSQMMMTLSLALPLWMSLILFNVLKNTNHFFSHLVPLSTPLPLSQFMTLIETVSQIIRPITLSVRLCANMTAGHILMALASKSITMLSTMTAPLSILIGLELAVAFIQSYVFTMLMSMYLSEIE